MELITKLGIDWKLLAAQIVNFFILLFVLYKFVYGPVLKMLEHRSKTIEKGLNAAKDGEVRLAQIEKEREEKMSVAEKQIGILLEKARTDAESMKKEIVDAASKQAEDLLRRARLQIEEEKVKLVADVKREIAQFIILATGKILDREFSDGDQKRLIDAVSKEMQTV